MRIVHLCGVAYLDGWGYQDNLLPEYQARLGHEVHVIAPGNHFPAYLKEEERQKIQARGKEYDWNGVQIHRIPVHLSAGNFSLVYSGLYRLLCRLQPQFIFHHGVAAPLLVKASLYTALHRGVKLVVDNHSDYLNCSRNKAWFLLYNRGVERLVAWCCRPVISRAYGVTPLRCDFLRRVTGFPAAKISLLPIGGDTLLVDSITQDRAALRQKYGIDPEAFLVVSGGKMGTDKGTHWLIQAVEQLAGQSGKVKLLLFGQFQDEETRRQAQASPVVAVEGWCNRQQTLEILKMADIACWPVHHTTLIEDAVACATPLVLRRTGNTEHLVQENGRFVAQGTTQELFEALSCILQDYGHYAQGAQTLREKYSYWTIAQQALDVK